MVVLAAASISAAAYAGDFDIRWTRMSMDQSRTGTRIITADNVTEALGRFDGKTYVAPNGRRFKEGTVTASVARLMLDVQPKMAAVKEVIGYCPETMVREAPESALTDLYVDQLMLTAERLSGEKVDFGVANFGGVRTDLVKGDILLDDILSMFPFKNSVCYLKLYGRDIRALLEQFARTRRFQIVGGVRCVVKDGRLKSVSIGGKPLEDNKVYGVAAISFVLNGGDDIFAAKNALDLRMYDVMMGDFMVDYIREQTAQGKPIVYQKDGRIVYE